MKRIAQIAAALLMAGPVLADPPAPYPITVNSKADTVASITAYRANSRTYRVSFTDGTTASVVTGRTPFMAWATNSSATTYSTANWAYVSGTTGQVDFTFAPAAVNYAAGRYVYEVGVKLGTVPTVYRQGVFIIQGSPIAQGVGPVTWSSNINWSLYEFTGTSGYGPVRPDNSTIICTTNADGSITLAATGVGGATWASVSGKPVIITELAATNGANLKALNATQLTSGTVPLARLSGITSSQVATATDTAYRNPASASYSLTNVLAAVQSTSNQVYKSGRLVRVTFNTNYVSPAWLALQGYGSTNGNWAGTWQTLSPSYFRNWANITNHAAVLETSDTTRLKRDGSLSWQGNENGGGGTQQSTNWWKVVTEYLNVQHLMSTGPGVAIKLDNPIDGQDYKITNFNGRADSMYVAGGQTNVGVIKLLTAASHTNDAVRLGQLQAATNTVFKSGTNWVLQQSYVTGPWVVSQAYHDFGQATNRYDSVRVPFIATNGTYNVIHLGRWRSSAGATLYGLEGKVDNSTCSVRIAEQTFASTAYSTPASTNNQITLDTNGAIDDTFTDATWNTNNELMAILYNVGACTNGEFTLFWKW